MLIVYKHRKDKDGFQKVQGKNQKFDNSKIGKAAQARGVDLSRNQQNQKSWRSIQNNQNKSRQYNLNNEYKQNKNQNNSNWNANFNQSNNTNRTNNNTVSNGSTSKSRGKVTQPQIPNKNPNANSFNALENLKEDPDTSDEKISGDEEEKKFFKIFPK